MLDFDKAYCSEKPSSQANLITLGSTRLIDNENNRNMSLIPPKVKGKSHISEHKLHIYLNSKDQRESDNMLKNKHSLQLNHNETSKNNLNDIAHDINKHPK